MSTALKQRLLDSHTRVRNAGEGRMWNHWQVNAPAGTTAAQVMDPDWWVNVAAKMRRNDRIEIISEDGSLDMDVRVVAMQARALYLRPLRVWFEGMGKAEALPVQTPPVDPEKNLPRAEWGGPSHKHRVLGLDGEVVAKGFESRELAVQEMERLFPQTRKAA